MSRFRGRLKIAVLIFVWLLCIGSLTWGTQKTDDNQLINHPMAVDRIPDVFVSFDIKDGGAYALVIETSTQQLYAYAYDGSYKKIYQCKTSTGEIPGPKTRSGDKKTPQGVYFFIKQHEKKDLSPVYGSRAYPTDYPNILDRLNGRTGNAIWLHGTNKPLKDRDSNGCIVLENNDINALASYIDLNRTPIIIIDRIHYVSTEEKNGVGEAISRFLSEWERALEDDTYHEFLKYYDAGYLPDISWWMEWCKVRDTYLALDIPLCLEIKNTAIFNYNGGYVVLFDQYMASREKTIYAGRRQLFLQPHDRDGLRIIGEDYRVIPTPKKDQTGGKPMMIVSRQLKASLEEDQKIPELINQWLRAWSGKDIKTYGSLYARPFRSQSGDGRNAWLQYKNRLNRKYDYIRVSIDNLDIDRGENKSTVSFIQTYDSNLYKSVCKKTLILIREEGAWKIYRETSEEI